MIIKQNNSTKNNNLILLNQLESLFKLKLNYTKIPKINTYVL